MNPIRNSRRSRTPLTTRFPELHSPLYYPFHFPLPALATPLTTPPSTAFATQFSSRDSILHSTSRSTFHGTFHVPPTLHSASKGTTVARMAALRGAPLMTIGTFNTRCNDRLKETAVFKMATPRLHACDYWHCYEVGKPQVVNVRQSGHLRILCGCFGGTRATILVTFWTP